MTTPTNAPEVETKAQDAKVDQNLNKSRTFILYYHFRAAAPLTKVFEFDGTLKDAVARAELHCKRMNYRFIKVRPFIIDFDEQEKRRNDEGYFDREEI
jgi:hypothetical protein